MPEGAAQESADSRILQAECAPRRAAWQGGRTGASAALGHKCTSHARLTPYPQYTPPYAPHLPH